jgi:hypothetical protein
MSPHRNREIYDVHDATLKFVETVLAPLKPPERAEWAHRHLPKTSALALTHRDFEEISR